jgi:hypothetical protein
VDITRDGTIVRAIEDMQSITDVVLFSIPVEGGFIVGEGSDFQIHGRQAGNIAGVERTYNPIGKSCGVAILANAIYIIGVGIDTIDCEECISSSDGREPTGSLSTAVAYLIGLGRVAPTE